MSIKLSEEVKLQPNYEVSESDEAYLVTVVLPGVQKEAVDVSVSSQRLRISAETASESEDSGWQSLQRAVPAGVYSLELKLGDSVDVEGIEGKHDLGILHLTLPKVTNHLARTITVD